jgi:hypothetical protein
MKEKGSRMACYFNERISFLFSEQANMLDMYWFNLNFRLLPVRISSRLAIN